MADTKAIRAIKVAIFMLATQNEASDDGLSSTLYMAWESLDAALLELDPSYTPILDDDILADSTYHPDWDGTDCVACGKPSHVGLFAYCPILSHRGKN